MIFTRQGKIPPFVLIGNKVDLREQRQVTYSEAKELAHYWQCPFFETIDKKETYGNNSPDNIKHVFFIW